MARNCRFAVAVHIATLLALGGDRPATSDWIAGSVNTNPVVVRRLLSALAKAGLVKSVRGSNGGSILARPAATITLLDINRAVAEDEKPPLHNQPPNPQCPVGKHIGPVLTTILNRATDASDAILAATTLDQVAAQIQPPNKTNL